MSISFHACYLNLENLVNSSCVHLFPTVVCICRGAGAVPYRMKPKFEPENNHYEMISVSPLID